jgi:hypothetical protein
MLDLLIQYSVTSLNNRFVASAVFGLTISLPLTVEPRGPDIFYRG